MKLIFWINIYICNFGVGSCKQGNQARAVANPYLHIPGEKLISGDSVACDNELQPGVYTYVLYIWLDIRGT